MSASSPAATRNPAAASRPGRLAGRRVVIVLNWPVLGGSERQALQLAQHLGRVEGAAVEVQALTADEGRAVRLFRAEEIPWQGRRVRLRRGKIRTLRTLMEIGLDLRGARPDVLLPYCGLPNVVCGLVWRFTGAETCIWNQRDVLPYALGEDFARRAARNTPCSSRTPTTAPHISSTSWTYPVAACPWCRTAWRFRRLTRVAPSGARVSEHATATSSCARSRTSTRGRTTPRSCGPGESPRRDSRRRGRPASSCSPGVTTVTASPVAALVRELDLERSVRFAGDVDDVAGLLEAADAGVLSSPAEGCPNALLECMAAGQAVAGTDVAGIREAVGDDGLSLLAPVGDSDGLGAALLRLGREPGLRQDLGARNRERVRSRFDADRMFAEHVALILGGLARSRTVD